MTFAKEMEKFKDSINEEDNEPLIKKVERLLRLNKIDRDKLLELLTLIKDDEKVARVLDLIQQTNCY